MPQSVAIINSKPSPVGWSRKAGPGEGSFSPGPGFSRRTAAPFAPRHPDPAEREKDLLYSLFRPATVSITVASTPRLSGVYFQNHGTRKDKTPAAWLPAKILT